MDWAIIAEVAAYLVIFFSRVSSPTKPSSFPVSYFNKFESSAVA